ncbi:MAG: hypothetical protein K2O70_10540, partial [Desulfovibrionaceae bacterium]|nr:hypothetical protein [Desulfovibrionaceae bacterium]
MGILMPKFAQVKQNSTKILMFYHAKNIHSPFCMSENIFHNVEFVPPLEKRCPAVDQSGFTLTFYKVKDEDTLAPACNSANT